jgi:hypothetical protein
MLRILATLPLLLLFTGCNEAGKADDTAAINPSDALQFWPPEAAKGQTFDARITAAESILDFETSTLKLGEGVTVNSFTVLDGWNAVANITVAEDAALGFRDARIETHYGEKVVGEALNIVADSFILTPARGRIGETLQVELIGERTTWEAGKTWTGFGDDITVTSVDVLSENYALATVTIGREAVPGLRDVTMETGPDVTTAYNAFQVDRVALGATFDPTTIQQGESLDFTILAKGTHFDQNTVVSFWNGNDENPDIQVDRLVVVDAENIYGTITASNAAEIGFRDVHIDTWSQQGVLEGVVVEDGLEVKDTLPGLENVGISLSFYVVRGIDNSTGAISEYVQGSVVFYIPLDPPCPNSPESAACSNGADDDSDGFTDCYDTDCASDPACGSGPQPYDNNGVFPTYQQGGTSDCPNPETVGAGDHVWFESDCNIVTFDKNIDAATGMIYYAADLTLDDYCFDQVYDLHTQGEEGAIGEYILEDVQPTVPADFSITSPQLWNNYTQSRTEDFNYTWTPAQTYPDAIFGTQISGTLIATGEGGFAGSLPWDDGVHAYTPDELGQLEAGPVTFTAYSYIEGRRFGFPFSTIQSNKSDSVVQISASMVLE